MCENIRVPPQGSHVEPMLKYSDISIKQKLTALKAQGKCVIADVICYWKMTSFILIFTGKRAPASEYDNI